MNCSRQSPTVQAAQGMGVGAFRKHAIASERFRCVRCFQRPLSLPFPPIGLGFSSAAPMILIPCFVFSAAGVQGGDVLTHVVQSGRSC